jgi:hypothetical protein
MRFIKMLGIAAVMAAAAMALVGTSSALAGPTSLCGSHEDECDSPFAKGTTIVGLAENNPPAHPLLLNTNSVDVICEHSEIKGKTDAVLGNPLSGTVTSLTWSNCETHGGTECDVTTVKNGTMLLLRTGLDVGTMQSHGTEVNVDCGSFIDCTYGGLPSLDVEGGSPAKVSAKNITLEETAGTFCPDTAQWLALYEITSPNPLHLSI